MQANKSQFFETSNFYLLHNIINNDLNKKFSYQLDGSSRNKLFEIMNNIYNRNNNLNLKDLNILTIRTAAPLFKQICENNSGIQNLETNNSLNRDMLIQKKMPDFVDMRPEYRNENSEDINRLKNIQEQIHENFISYVKSRRGSKIDSSKSDEIFSGLFWVGKKAIDLGLADGIGSINKIITDKFGKNAKIKYINQKKSFIQKRLSSSLINGYEIVRVIEEKAMWSRFGL